MLRREIIHNETNCFLIISINYFVGSIVKYGLYIQKNESNYEAAIEALTNILNKASLRSTVETIKL